MGNPKRIRKKYKSPKRPWNRGRILSERDLLEKYGLTSKKELRVMNAIIAKKRDAVKQLLAAEQEVAEKGKKAIIDSLNRIGIVSQDANMSDVLGLNVTDILERRLQTLVCRQGLARTAKQARQFVLHGFISVNAKRVNVPGYIVKKEEENTIDYYMGIKPKVMDVEMKKPDLHQKKEETEKEEKIGSTQKEPETKKEEEVIEDVVETEEKEEDEVPKELK